MMSCGTKIEAVFHPLSVLLRAIPGVFPPCGIPALLSPLIGPASVDSLAPLFARLLSIVALVNDMVCAPPWCRDANPIRAFAPSKTLNTVFKNVSPTIHDGMFGDCVGLINKELKHILDVSWCEIKSFVVSFHVRPPNVKSRLICVLHGNT